MPGKSDYLENTLLDLVLGGGSYTSPANVYVALFTANPSDAGGGTEVTGGDYERLELTNDDTNWPDAVDGLKTNGVDFIFPTASANWGTVIGFGIFDDPTAGNMLFWGGLNDDRTVNTGDVAKFLAGTLNIQEE